MALAATGRSEQQQVGALGEPGVSRRHRHHLGLGDHRHGVEVEAVQGFARRQARLGQVTFDAAPVALGQFVFGDGGEEAGRRPSLLVGPLGEVGPHKLDGGQAQFAQHDAQAGCVDRGGGVHTASPIGTEPSRLS